MYSFISDKAELPFLRAVYQHYGSNVSLMALYAYNYPDRQVDILSVASDAIKQSIIDEIQEFLIEEGFAE